MYEDLEKQYAPSQWVPETLPEDVLMFFHIRISRGSYIAAGTVPNRLGVSYGETENSKIDIFGEEELSKGAPIFVFVHGGFWIAGSRDQSSFFVRPFYSSKILCAVLGYDLVTDSFTLPELVTQIQHGIKFILELARTRGSRGVYFCGHSAGAHLISMALSSEPADKDLNKLIKGIVLISGIYDLNPILKTSNATAAHVTSDIAEYYSPLKFVNTLKENIDLTTKILILAADHDSPAFKEQSENYFEILKNSEFERIELKIYPQLDHFMIVYNLGNDCFEVTKKLIEFVTSEDSKIHQELKKEAKLRKAEEEANKIKEEPVDTEKDKLEETMVEDKNGELNEKLASKDLYENAKIMCEALGKMHEMDCQKTKESDQPVDMQTYTNILKHYTLEEEEEQQTNLPQESAKIDNNEHLMETQQTAELPPNKSEILESEKSSAGEMQMEELLQKCTDLTDVKESNALEDKVVEEKQSQNVGDNLPMEQKNNEDLDSKAEKLSGEQQEQVVDIGEKQQNVCEDKLKKEN